MTESNGQQDASLTVLVASTLGASLSAVPQSQKAPADPPAPQISTSHEVGFRQESQERHASRPAFADSSAPDDCSNMDTGNRKRINLTRLHFNAKKSDGSKSSREGALTKQDSFTAVPTSPRQMSQPSLDGSSVSKE